MSDQEHFNEQPTPIDPNSAPEPLKETQQQSVRETRDVPVEAVPTEQLPDVARDVKEAEPEDVKAARRQTEAILNKPIEAIEDTINAVDAADHPQHPAGVLAHPVSDVTVIQARKIGPINIPYRVIPMPVYTVVFITLAIITIVEVASAEIFPGGVGLTAWLFVLSVLKALLVMWFYMHLKDDSRIFVIAITLPILIALVATLFLSAVPPTGY